VKKLPDCVTLKKLYWGEKFLLSQVQIADMYEVTRAAVSYAMSRCEIKPRSQKDARRLGTEKGRVTYSRKDVDESN